MNRLPKLTAMAFACWGSLGIAVSQDFSIAGQVLDEVNREPLVGANVVIEGSTVGTVTDVSGKFSLTVHKVPLTLVFSFVGYESVSQQVAGSVTNIKVSLKEKVILGEEVVVSASLMEESIMQSPVSIEKLDIKAIRQMSAPNFYDGLSTLKGVDMSVHSLLFKVPNTRGFNGNTGVRMGQVVDGMDNTVPGLSFAAGNIFGSSQLDLESVELLLGASSALYGPGSMNGVLLMNTKNPFDYQGLSASAQVGVLNIKAADAPVSPMVDFNVRYAKAFNKKLAFKISVGYIAAEDWHANDLRDRTNPERANLTRESNPGYDGVNVYGDDIVVPVNLSEERVAGAAAAGYASAFSNGQKPGEPLYDQKYKEARALMPDQVISRTGYKEKYLVNYGTHSLRAGGAVHYRFHKELEAIAQVGYSRGTSVYTAQNRFSLKNFGIVTGRLELKSPTFSVRTYGVFEDAGDTYDAANSALLMNEAWKPSEKWYEDYVAAFVQNRIVLQQPLEDAYRFARQVADNRDQVGNSINSSDPALPLPGTPEFTSLFNSISRKPINQGGTRVIDHSYVWHTEGMYNFKKLVKFMEIVLGASYRRYAINSEGTIFIDTPGTPITINQFGAFLQLSKKILRDRIKLLASARYDKNEFFKGRFTPRASAVYSIDKNERHNVRFSFQTAFRFPTISDQWVDINTGHYYVLGGQERVLNKYQFNTKPVYALDGSNPVNNKPLDTPFNVPTLRPEEVTSFELGYKGLMFSKMLLIDGYVYRSEYNGFLATQALAQDPNTPNERRFLTTISTDFPVLTYGWALGFDLLLVKGFMLRSNVNYNTFELVGKPPVGYRSNFNTPAYRYNVSLHNSGLLKNTSFNVNWRWQQGYHWESSFGVTDIPAFGTLDASVALSLPKLHSSVKVGGSNLLNRYYTTSFGSAQVGGLYYISWTLDNIL